jgi:hypothetical protein
VSSQLTLPRTPKSVSPHSFLGSRGGPGTEAGVCKQEKVDPLGQTSYRGPEASPILRNCQKILCVPQLDTGDLSLLGLLTLSGKHTGSEQSPGH